MEYMSSTWIPCIYYTPEYWDEYKWISMTKKLTKLPRLDSCGYIWNVPHVTERDLKLHFITHDLNAEKALDFY